MKLKITTLLLLFFMILQFPGVVSAAIQYNINLELKPLKIESSYGRDFYIKGIIDGRNAQSNISFTGANLAEVLQPLMDITFKQHDRIPIVIKVTVLQIIEGPSDIAKAEAKLIYYRESDGKLAKIFETEEGVGQKNKKHLAQIHDMNIYQVISASLSSFVEHQFDWKKVDPSWEDYQTVVSQTSIEDQTIIGTFPDKRSFISIAPLYSPNIGEGMEMIYWGSFANETNEAGWIPRFGLGFTVISENRGLEGNKIDFLELTYGRFKWFANSDLAFGFECGLPLFDVLGLTKYSGLIISENFLLIPKDKFSDFPVVASLGLFQAFQGNRESGETAFDAFGLRVSVGMQL